MHRFVVSFLLIVPALAWPLAASGQGRGGQARDRQAPVRRGTAVIAGKVYAAESGRPMRLVRITATAPELTDGDRVTVTDENGAFELPELPAGRYVVSASKIGYIGVNYGQRRPLRAGRPIEVRDGERVAGIDFRLSRGSAITGRVLDQDGEPLVRANVRAIRWRMVQGERRVEYAGTASTDDRGVFRLFDVQPGTYFVAATAQSTDIGRVAMVQDGRVMAVSPSNETPPVTYLPTYYPGVPALSDAAPIAVGVSEEIAGIDFSLQLVTAARVSGFVMSPAGAVSGSSVLMVADTSLAVAGSSYSARSNRDGSFSILNVAPGRYSIVARGGGGGGRGQRGEQDMFALASITVAGAAVSDVSLMLTPGATVSGTVSVEGGRTPSPQEISRIQVRLWTPAAQAIPTFGNMTGTGPRADGSFTLAGVAPGSRMVRVLGLPKGWSLKAVYLDGRDVTDDMFEVRPGESAAHMNVVLTDKGTTLSGSVLDEHDQPLNGFTVVAFPTDSNLWRPQSRFIQAIRADRNGAYAITGLPPGEYLLRATDDVDQGEWFDPEFLQAQKAGATRVVLGEGDVKTVDVKVAGGT